MLNSQVVSSIILPEQFDSAFFKGIPDAPGVYFFVGENGEMLYIGKAKCLRKRLLTHRRSGQPWLELTREIRWELCESETAAFAREGALLRALRPRFNIAGVEPDYHLFIGVFTTPARNGRVQAHFRLASENNYAPEFSVFGCFKHRRKTKTAYTALMRLLFAAHFSGKHFHYPSRLTQDSPPWEYSQVIEEECLISLRAFLRGRSLCLLRQLSLKLIENPLVPPFMSFSIQADLDLLHEFFQYGPKFTRDLRSRFGLRRISLSQDLMDLSVLASV